MEPITIEPKSIIPILGELKICDLTTDFEVQKVFPHVSVSDSMIIFGNILKKTDVAIKISFGKMDEHTDNSLEVERLIYKKVIKKLVDENCTPHLVYPYGEILCEDFWITLQKNINLKTTILNQIDKQMDNIPEHPKKFIERKFESFNIYLKNMDIIINWEPYLNEIQKYFDGISFDFLLLNMNEHEIMNGKLYLYKKLKEFIASILDLQNTFWNKMFIPTKINEKDITQNKYNNQQKMNFFSYILQFYTSFNFNPFEKPSLVQSRIEFTFNHLQNFSKDTKDWDLKKFEMIIDDYINSLAVKTSHYRKDILKSLEKSLIGMITDGYTFIYRFMNLIANDLSKIENEKWKGTNSIYIYSYILYDILRAYISKEEKYITNKSIYDINSAHFIILEKTSGITFSDWIYEVTDEMNFKKVIFQILYTLHVFNKNGIRHNDLHMKNIFVDYYEKPKSLSYYIKDIDKYYSFKSNFMVKIFDFDFGFVEGIGMYSEKVKKYCDKYGICNIQNPKFDTFRVLKSLYKVASEYTTFEQIKIKSLILDFVFRSISIDLLKGIEGEILHFKKEYNIPTPKGNFIPNDDEMKQTKDILQDDLFKDLFPSGKEEVESQYQDKIIKIEID